MKQVRIWCVCLALVALVSAGCKKKAAPTGTVVGEEITYQAGTTKLKGYLAYDKAKQGKRPGVIVVHEWWGHNAYARKRATMLATMGYVALALDMYGDGKQANHPKDAMAFATSVFKNMPEGENRFKAALDTLAKHPMTDAKKIAAIGYCFGGGIVLHVARKGFPLVAVASFHGMLGSMHKANKGEIKAEILVLNGEKDPMVKPEAITAFKQEMTDAGAKFKFVNYPGVLHSFTNPDATENGKKFKMPLAYDKKADEQSWTEMKTMFTRVFGS